jgi:exodeoxyribonuclease V alpha subunit
MADFKQQLRQAGFSELSCQFATMILRREHNADEWVASFAAVLSEWVSQGHVCLNLFKDSTTWSLESLAEGSAEQNLARLRASNVVGKPGDYCPLILTDDGLLYLYRYWQAEQDIAAQLTQRQHSKHWDSSELKALFADWLTKQSGIDWQKVAVMMALHQQFSVISGGPGTGKTTIVKRLLAAYQQLTKNARIALAAPTGKAAARLQQAVADEQSYQAKTLHRLLGISEHQPDGKYHPDNPLAVDLLIVDEASMVDVSMMATLLQALPETASLVLLGDSEQLASVESGAVLANLCDRQVAFSAEFVKQCADCLAMDLSEFIESDTTASLLTDKVVKLQYSYRFDANSFVGQLAQAVREQDQYQALNLLRENQQWFDVSKESQRQQFVTGYSAYIDAVNQRLPAAACLDAFDQFQVLTALRQGRQSVDSVNQLMQSELAKQGWQSQQRFYHGRPIMITVNDYRHQLFNGDIGLILVDDSGQLRACFRADDGVRWVGLNRLPQHETVFAMTVHKSQGSEFSSVAILLAEELNPVLNRELLYTAITRAREQVKVLSTETVLTHTIATQHQRESGLTAQLLANSAS